MPAWPAPPYPQKPMIGPFGESSLPSTFAFKPDRGEPLTRPEYSGSIRIYNIRLKLNADDYDTFWEWYETILRDGALPFDWAHPVKGNIRKWKCDPDTAPNVNWAGANLFFVSFRVYLLPG